MHRIRFEARLILIASFPHLTLTISKLVKTNVLNDELNWWKRAAKHPDKEQRKAFGKCDMVYLYTNVYQA